MNGSEFDRFVKSIGTRMSRRSIVLLLVGFTALWVQKAKAQLKQLTPSTCAAQGEVCTHLRGCCDALTCVTSSINTNYGVCAPGDGGTVSIGTTLISPFSDDIETEIAALASDATTDDTSSTTTATDLEAEREQRIADKKLRKENRRDDQKLRKQNQQNEQQDRREDRRLEREDRRGPRLHLEIFNAGKTDPVETVRVTNRADEDVILNSINSLPPPGAGTDLLPNGYRLEPGDSVLLLSEHPSLTQPTIEGNRVRWTAEPICSGISDDGFMISAAFSSDLDNHDFVVLCDASEADNDGKNRRRKKRRKRSNQGRGRDKSKN